MTENKKTMQTTTVCPCEKCGEEILISALSENAYICPRCGEYHRAPARARIAYLVDGDSFREHGANLISENPMCFPGYEAKLCAAMKTSGECEGVICGEARLEGHPICLFAMEPTFMMGSMGMVVGDKIAALFEYATEKGLPMVGYTVSGGTRMQEGMLSLLQMAKVAGAAKLHSDAGLFFLVCLTDPTLGGVTASIAMLGDVIIAEPGATIGFAGQRVLEQVTGTVLPEGFQSAEFQLKNGFLDAIVPRKEQRAYIARLMRIHARRGGWE